MASWDVFHAESLELERGLSSEAIRAALASGALREDDLVRPSGTTAAWGRLGDLPDLMAPPAPAGADAAGAPAMADPPRESAHRPERPRESAHRPERPPESGEAPGRIRARRDDAPPPAPLSDFEVRADDSGPTPQPDVSTTTAPPPAWVQLGGEPDDVTFPVIPGPPDPRSSNRPPAPSGAAPGREPPVPPAWSWPDDDEEVEASPDQGEAGVDVLDEQIEILDDDSESLEILDEDDLSVPSPFSREAASSNGTSRVALPVVPSRDWNEDRAPVEDGAEEDFTLSRSGPMTVEELDLAPMVDVAFQLVLFFMVTATTVLYKTLEIPKPTTDQAPGAVAQGHSRSMEDLQKDYVLVEIDPGGAIKIDRDPVAATHEALAERLRSARDKTGRKIMLLSADYATPHRNAVLAYDAAIEIGMGIAIARPNPPQEAAPSVFPGAGRGGAPRPAAAGASPTAKGPAQPPSPASPAPGSAPF